MEGAIKTSRVTPAWLRVTTWIAAGLLTLIAVAAVGYREAYNVWPGQAADARIHWCGRNYENFGGAPETWQQLSAQAPFPVRRVARYPPLGWRRQELFAAVTPGSQRDSVSPPLPCAMIVYLRAGPDAYQPYGLEGGP